MIFLEKFINKNLNSYLDEFKDRNCFNPSHLYCNGMLFITFRSYGEKQKKPFCATLLIIKKEVSTIDLSDYCMRFGISNVADPKLLKLKNEVWITFNTGFNQSGNEIYLLKVWPQLGVPQKCIFKDRSLVEKNWCFFIEDEKIHALYSLNPIVILKAEGFTFKEVFRKKVVSRKLSLGSQICHFDGKGYFVAHEKKTIFNKRLYLGVIGSLSKKDGEYDISFSQKRFVHSLISLFGSMKKHNKNLISCTYFSGLSFDQNMITLSYGINDLASNFVTLEKEKLWS